MTASDDDIAAVLRDLALQHHRSVGSEDDRASALKLLVKARTILNGGADRLRWYEVDPDEPVGTRARNRELSAFSGSVNAAAPPMTLRLGQLGDGTPAMIGTVELDRLREGPPGAVHGGVIAGLFDEIMGAASRLNAGPAGVTGRLVVRYRQPTPLAEPLEFRAWIDEERPVLLTIRAECRHGATVTASADALFVRDRS